MKKVVWTLGALMLTSRLAMAQEVKAPAKARATADRSALEKTLIANERKVLEALMQKDKATFTSLYAGDGLLVDGSGVMKTSALVPLLDQLVIKSYAISDEKVSWVDPNTAIVTYKWLGTGSFNGQLFPSTEYASTVWTKRGDKWVAVFHQESEVKK